MESTHYIKNPMDDPWYMGKFWVGGHDHYRSIFFVFPISQPIIEILTHNFLLIILGSTRYNKNIMVDHGYLGKFWLGGHDCYRSIFFVYPIS